MPDLAEHEERAIRAYVNSQSPRDDQAGLVQRVKSQRILGRVHEVFDVHCVKTRWWVITDPTNLYLQERFPDAEQALIFHIGLGAVLAERSRGDLATDDEQHVPAPWRRYRDALTVMDEADEAEDFQSVGIKCRDALIALGKIYQDAEWLGEVVDPPKVADFKGWGPSTLSGSLATGCVTTSRRSSRRPGTSLLRSNTTPTRLQPTRT